LGNCAIEKSKKKNRLPSQQVRSVQGLQAGNKEDTKHGRGRGRGEGASRKDMEELKAGGGAKTQSK